MMFIAACRSAIRVNARRREQRLAPFECVIYEHCNTGVNGYPAVMRIILVRHYRTQSNQQDRILGWGDSPPYPDWKTNVDYIDNQLRQNDVSIDAIFCSDLQRSRLTAQVYATSFGIADITSHPALKEINYGELQTRHKSWVAEHYPQHKKDPDFVYPAGESFRQMQQRSVEFFSSLAISNAQQTILIVSHAGVIRGIISHFFGLEYARSLRHGIPFRYIGDFLMEGANCLRYDELGKPSGFVRDDIIELPFTQSNVPD